MADAFLAIYDEDMVVARGALAVIKGNWSADLVPFAIDSLYLRRHPMSLALVALLQEETGQSFGYDPFAWWQWLWDQPAPQHPAYGDFKARLYGQIDPAFRQYFGRGRRATVRLDEVVWGGVGQDGIPPLRHPRMIGAAQARYLEDDNVVFGIAVGEDVRAYPRRILAWHEMFVDEVGGKAVAGVY